MRNNRIKGEQALKPSQYNHFFRVEEEVLAYNAFSNSFISLTQTKYEVVEKILNDMEGFPWGDEDNINLKNNLHRLGFLIDSHLDEYGILELQNKIGRFSNKILSLTIAPTLNCNFKCSYCFEKRKYDTINQEIESALIKFVDNKLKFLKLLSVSWFGGEPLLRIDIIERLSEAFNEICIKQNAQYKQGLLITNGYLLDSVMALRLKNIGINGVQITLDGPPSIHNNRRMLISGKGTFKKIFENIKAICDIISVTVRINIDKENSNDLDGLFKLWEDNGLKEKVPFYFGQVQGNSRACADVVSSCYTTKEYSTLLVELIRKTQGMGYKSTVYPFLNKGGSCIADKLNGFVVSPSGKLFKCWEEISEEEDQSIGNICDVELKPQQIMNSVKYLNYDNFKNIECKQCNIFPICTGGCIYNAINTGENKDCKFWKYSLEKILQLKYNILRKN